MNDETRFAEAPARGRSEAEEGNTAGSNGWIVGGALLASLRLGLLATSFAVVAFCGIYAAYYLFSDQGLSVLEKLWNSFEWLGVDVSFKETVYVSLGAISVGLTLALIRELINSLPHMVEFLVFENRRKATKALLLTIATSFVFSFGVVASSVSYIQYSEARSTSGAENRTGVGQPDPEPRFNVILGGDGHIREAAAPEAMSFLIMFYEDATADAVEQGHGIGLRVPEDQLLMLKHIAEMASACSAEGNRRAILQLIGSASSEPFEELALRKSNQYNRRLANLRAQQVAKFLAGYSRQFVAEKDRVGVTLWEPEIRAHSWRSYEDMVRARRFNDRDSEGNYIDERARLTRSVEIQLFQGGGCAFQILGDSRTVMAGNMPAQGWASR